VWPAAVRSLAATLGWVERRLHAEQDITPVPLDDTLRRLAEQGRQGQQSAAVLLDAPTRAAHQYRIDELGRLESQIEQTVAEALEHSRTLATAEPGTDAQAVTAYRNRAVVVAGYQKKLPTVRSHAADAARALSLDDKHREVHGPHVMTGESARAQLLARLRARLDAAVAAGALLPAWLILALGHQPVGEDVGKWMTRQHRCWRTGSPTRSWTPLLRSGGAPTTIRNAKPGARTSNAGCGTGATGRLIWWSPCRCSLSAFPRDI
jgi:hypothetical protein